MPHLLLAEDDSAIGKAIKDGLETAGFKVTWVKNGSEVLPMIDQNSYSLLILDLMLPGLDGLEVCVEIRRHRQALPILMVTARDAVADRVDGLNSGADDYMTKPFEFPELLARVRALLRRHHVIKTSVIEIGDLVIDTTQKTVKRGTREILLTPREFTLLEALAQNAGAVLSKEEIAMKVWEDEFTSSNTVEVHVKNLRRKLDDEGETKLIHTLHGMGYSLRSL
jgi:two-component system copper resistance phosphate regulon response regulator CusR